MSDKPTTIAVATYTNEANAELDYDMLRGVKSMVSSTTSPSRW